jgi:hypothetical protein
MDADPSEGNYRRAFAQGDRIIIANDCLILLISQMDEREARAEQPEQLILLYF